MLEGRAIDLAQLLGEQVGAKQRTVELLDAGELCLLAFGQVLRVLPQRETCALQFSSDLALTLETSLVPDLAANLIQGITGELDHVKGVHTTHRVCQALCDRA